MKLSASIVCSHRWNFWILMKRNQILSKYHLRDNVCKNSLYNPRMKHQLINKTGAQDINKTFSENFIKNRKYHIKFSYVTLASISMTKRSYFLLKTGIKLLEQNFDLVQNWDVQKILEIIITILPMKLTGIKNVTLVSFICKAASKVSISNTYNSMGSNYCPTSFTAHFLRNVPVTTWFRGNSLPFLGKFLFDSLITKQLKLIYAICWIRHNG